LIVHHSSKFITVVYYISYFLFYIPKFLYRVGGCSLDYQPNGVGEVFLGGIFEEAGDGA
jgi:hypothetical protein